VSKSRPRETTPLTCKDEVQYWQRRLFRNTFTYKGRRREVSGWAVKIQLFGRRKTFSLSSSNVTQAASEACQIYQVINTHGWDALEHHRGKVKLTAVRSNSAATSTAQHDIDHWKGRLISRRYPESTDDKRELSVRIEHSGASCYFPLGTPDESEAAEAAKRIHQTVDDHGWPDANQKFRRELTLAFRWLDDPLAWTYTTIHTWKHGDPVPPVGEPNSKAAAHHVAVIEPDAGIRFALVANVSSQSGFQSCAAYSSMAEALREIPRRKIDLVLINYAMPEQSGAGGLETLQQSKATTLGLAYSVFEDSDRLFQTTPGGAAGYLLKRTPAQRIFDPIADTAGPLTREIVAAKIREYFQRLVAAMPSGPSAVNIAKLTPREHEILALLAKGDLAKEIAESLGISIWTVHGHVKSIFEKLNVHTRTEAVVKFLQK
jgi:DNA-binding NarL/FixJ family response regulator